jgi:hypothetical protein
MKLSKIKLDYVILIINKSYQSNLHIKIKENKDIIS